MTAGSYSNKFIDYEQMTPHVGDRALRSQTRTNLTSNISRKPPSQAQSLPHEFAHHHSQRNNGEVRDMCPRNVRRISSNRQTQTGLGHSLVGIRDDSGVCTPSARVPPQPNSNNRDTKTSPWEARTQERTTVSEATATARVEVDNQKRNICSQKRSVGFGHRRRWGSPEGFRRQDVLASVRDGSVDTYVHVRGHEVLSGHCLPTDRLVHTRSRLFLLFNFQPPTCFAIPDPLCLCLSLALSGIAVDSRKFR